MKRFEPTDVGWPLGRSHAPNTRRPLWVPWDRTTGVVGPQGSGKTLDLLVPALLNAPGGALVTLTKPEDMLLTIGQRSQGGRPCVVLDPFGQVPGLSELIFDPLSGCDDPMVAERRAKAFTAGTVTGSDHGSDDAARFYAAEAAKVIGAYLHAAALQSLDLATLLSWVAAPRVATEPLEILRTHSLAAPHWHRLLQGAVHGDDRTSANTTTTVQQALSLFFQPSILARCAPSAGRPATDVADVIARGGTFYLLGREDPYASASPLMTAVAEHIFDTALQLANRSPHGRLCPPFAAVLDELPSTAPLPTLATRMANERALGLSFVYATQTWRQLAAVYGEQTARSLLGLTNVLALFGGSKDVAFNREISDLLGTVRISRTTYQRGGRHHSAEDIPVISPAEIRELPQRQALIVAENGKPIIAKLSRAIDGDAGKQLLAAQADARRHVDQHRTASADRRADRGRDWTLT